MAAQPSTLSGHSRGAFQCASNNITKSIKSERRNISQLNLRRLLVADRMERIRGGEHGCVEYKMGERSTRIQSGLQQHTNAQAAAQTRLPGRKSYRSDSGLPVLPVVSTSRVAASRTHTRNDSREQQRVANELFTSSRFEPDHDALVVVWSGSYSRRD